MRAKMIMQKSGTSYRIFGLNFSGKLAIAQYYSEILQEWVELKNISMLVYLAKFYKRNKYDVKEIEMTDENFKNIVEKTNE